jgi:hypothetical protein
MNGLALPQIKTVDYSSGDAASAAKGRGKFSCRRNPRNPLISLDSDERIQGNPRKSKAPDRGFR